MSKAIGGGGNNDLMLVVVLIVGAVMYTRMRPALAGQQGRTVYVPSSASGANGNGVSQVTSGILGGIAGWLSGSGNTPDTFNGTDTSLNSFGTLGPIGGSIEDPWYG